MHIDSMENHIGVSHSSITSADRAEVSCCQLDYAQCLNVFVVNAGNVDRCVQDMLHRVDVSIHIATQYPFGR